MHAFQEWVQQYQTNNKALLESVRSPMGMLGTGIAKHRNGAAQQDLPSGSLEALAQIQQHMRRKNQATLV
jgi:hypothetical protein